MEQKESKFSFKNSIFDKGLNILYPLIIAVFSMYHVNKGLEITDTAYNYCNFKFSSGLDDMWYFSTFLSNFLGHLFTKLPGGSTMLGMNFYTGLVKMGILLFAYFFLTNKVKLNKHAVFAGELMAAGLSWCPTAVLYNYLTYFFLFLGIVFIYEAVYSSTTKRENTFFALAGLCLGMNVFVRLPNLCEAALIIVVWYMSIIRKESFKVAFRKTMLCICGYIGSFLLCLALAAASRGIEAYIRGISEMFSGGGDAKSQYTPKGLIFTAFSGYIGIKYWAVFLVLALVCVLTFSLVWTKIVEVKVKSQFIKKYSRWIKLLVAFAVFLATIYKFRKTHLYTNNFYEYSSMYGISVIVLLISIGCMLIISLDKNMQEKERFLAACVLVLVIVTPLGSNNGMYSVINNQYLALPLLINCLIRKNRDKVWLEPVKATAFLFVCVGLVHSVLFGINFNFRDGGGIKLSASVENNEILRGMKTIPSNAQYLTEVTDVWKNGYEDSTVLVFGNAAGLSFYLDAKPAISTVWPSLASFSLDKFQREMKLLCDMHEMKDRPLPVIILGNDGIDGYQSMQEGDTSEIEAFLGETYIKKLEILYDFLNNYNYDEIYRCETFWVFAPKVD